MGEGQADQDGGAYRAYLVRLWRDGRDGPWRAMVKDAHTGEEWRFASLAHVCHFLHDRAGGTRE